jgi:hypothetical protein
MPDVADFLKKAERCRRLARSSDQREANILNEMASEYEVKARELNADRRVPSSNLSDESN